MRAVAKRGTRWQLQRERVPFKVDNTVTTPEHQICVSCVLQQSHKRCTHQGQFLQWPERVVLFNCTRGEGAPLYCECNQWVMIFVTVVILATEHNGGDNGNGKDGAGSDSAHMHSRRRNRRLKDRECICARRQAMREILFAHSHTLLHKSMHMIAFATATRTRHLNADTIEPTHAPQHSLPRCPHVLQRICVRGLASL